MPRKTHKMKVEKEFPDEVLKEVQEANDELLGEEMKSIKVRQIYWHDANYPDETNWISKGDVKKLIDELGVKPYVIRWNELKARIEGKNAKKDS